MTLARPSASALGREIAERAYTREFALTFTAAEQAADGEGSPLSPSTHFTHDGVIRLACTACDRITLRNSNELVGRDL